MEKLMLRVSDIKKEYRLGQIGGTTLQDELKRKIAKIRGQDDPTIKIGIEKTDVNKSFMALDGVSFDVKMSERVGIIGHNGAGKSTLLKLISRITAPTCGKIQMNGRVASMLEVGTGFHPELTGRENIYMNGAILGMTKKEIDSKINDIIRFSEVEKFIDTPVKRYSSGMYVKLAFSVAAHLDSEIVIMDEVLAVGDVKFQQKCLSKMRSIAENDGRTILYVSHNMSTIRELCNRVIVLDHGKIIFDGDVEDGIRVYTGAVYDELPIRYDLVEAPRPPYGHGKKLLITEVCFLGREKAIFFRSEQLEFTIKFKVKENLTNLRLYFTVVNDLDQNVGTTQTLDSFANVCCGNVYEYSFKMDLHCLDAGKYTFQPDIFACDDEGHNESYDRPEVSICFEVVDDIKEGIQWKKQYFGNVHLPVIHCEGLTNEGTKS